MGNRFRDQYDGQLLIAFIIFLLGWMPLSMYRLFYGHNGTETFWGVMMLAMTFVIAFTFLNFLNEPIISEEK